MLSGCFADSVIMVGELKDDTIVFSFQLVNYVGIASTSNVDELSR